MGHYLPTSFSSTADGPAAQRQQLQTAHSAAVPHPLPVPEGSSQVQKVSAVTWMICEGKKVVGSGFYSLFTCPHTVPVVFSMMIRLHGSKRQLNWFIRSVLTHHWSSYWSTSAIHFICIPLTCIHLWLASERDPSWWRQVRHHGGGTSCFFNQLMFINFKFLLKEFMHHCPSWLCNYSQCRELKTGNTHRGHKD